MQFLAKKSSKNESKSNKNSKAGLAPKRACRHFPSANWPKCLARFGNLLIEIKPIFFEFLEIRTHSNSYLISFLSIPNTEHHLPTSQLTYPVPVHRILTPAPEGALQGLPPRRQGISLARHCSLCGFTHFTLTMRWRVGKLF